MAKLTIVTRNGDERTIDGRPGWSVMENIRDSGIDELLALCGGCANCGTCHVHVDDQWLAKLPPIGPDEEDILAFSCYREGNSRLSCQIVFGDALDGIRVRIAPEE